MRRVVIAMPGPSAGSSGSAAKGRVLLDRNRGLLGGHRRGHPGADGRLTGLRGRGVAAPGAERQKRDQHRRPPPFHGHNLSGAPRRCDATSYGGPMLLRNARLVAVTEPVPAPVDVRVEGGRVVEVGPGLAAGGGETSYDAGAGG